MGFQKSLETKNGFDERLTEESCGVKDFVSPTVGIFNVSCRKCSIRNRKLRKLSSFNAGTCGGRLTLFLRR